jgi:ferritin-like metal-binding protein YciE
MQITSFRDMYVAELQELADLEDQLCASLQRMAGAAVHSTLKRVLMHQCEEAQGQKKRLEAMLQRHGADPKAHTDQAMQALIRETEKMLKILKGSDLRDAGLIASVQRLKHYEIAAYGTAAALAGQLNLRDDQRTLHTSLEEEKQADLALSDLAKAEVNQDAVPA